ncbi:MAG: hypothetical protein Kow0026_04220 [Oricola sp.]
MFRTILAATDGSAPGTRATEAAADIAGRFGSRLLVLSVVPPGPLPRGITQAAHGEAASAHPLLAKVPSWVDRARDQATRDTGESHAMLEELARLALNHAVTLAERHAVADCKTRVEHGDPAEIILDIAGGENADLIVLGRRGLGGIRQLLTGSVTSKVMQASDRMCLTVK